jgi:hypothetical protein
MEFSNATIQCFESKHRTTRKTWNDWAFSNMHLFWQQSGHDPVSYGSMASTISHLGRLDILMLWHITQAKGATEACRLCYSDNLHTTSEN